MSGYEPGVYSIPEADYFADPALSCSGAKLLLPPNCPALFRYRQDHPESASRKDVFDLGSAAHREVLGAGPDLAVINADSWQTKAAREKRDAARAEGRTPVLAADYERVKAMAEAIRRHPEAGPLLDPDRGGKAEQCLFWTDEDTGVPCRARLDLLPEPDWGRYIAVDYKTAEHAGLESVIKATANYGYYLQDDWYRAGIQALGLDGDPGFVFVFQEKDPPYLINVVQLDADARAAGRVRARQAREIFRDCTESGLWPGYEAENVRLYDDTIATISLPPWAARTLGASA
jgi:PDDEXK-like domain of unknown function (DUF3799)